MWGKGNMAVMFRTKQVTFRFAFSLWIKDQIELLSTLPAPLFILRGQKADESTVGMSQLSLARGQSQNVLRGRTNSDESRHRELLSQSNL